MKKKSETPVLFLEKTKKLIEKKNRAEFIRTRKEGQSGKQKVESRKLKAES